MCNTILYLGLQQAFDHECSLLLYSISYRQQNLMFGC